MEAGMHASMSPHKLALGSTFGVAICVILSIGFANSHSQQPKAKTATTDQVVTDQRPSEDAGLLERIKYLEGVVAKMVTTHGELNTKYERVLTRLTLAEWKVTTFEETYQLGNHSSYVRVPPEGKSVGRTYGPFGREVLMAWLMPPANIQFLTMFDTCSVSIDRTNHVVVHTRGTGPRAGDLHIPIRVFVIYR
jgi:hypothetical protein